LVMVITVPKPESRRCWSCRNNSSLLVKL